MKRVLLVFALSTSILLCLGKSSRLLQGKTQDGVGGNRGPALVLASLEGSQGSYQNAVALQGNGNQFGVDFSFNGPDGSTPTAPLIQDAAGNLYGTTSSGGYGFGLVFKLDSSNRETMLYAFQGPDGATPYGALVMDSSGTLYGTTSAGGDYGLGTA